jgi:hypothetical protein
MTCSVAIAEEIPKVLSALPSTRTRGPRRRAAAPSRRGRCAAPPARLRAGRRTCRARDGRTCCARLRRPPIYPRTHVGAPRRPLERWRTRKSLSSRGSGADEFRGSGSTSRRTVSGPAFLHRGLLFSFGLVGDVRRGGDVPDRAASWLSLRLSAGLGPDFLLFCRSSPVGDVWRDLIDAWHRLEQAVSTSAPEASRGGRGS